MSILPQTWKSSVLGLHATFFVNLDRTSAHYHLNLQTRGLRGGSASISSCLLSALPRSSPLRSSEDAGSSLKPPFLGCSRCLIIDIKKVIVVFTVNIDSSVHELQVEGQQSSPHWFFGFISTIFVLSGISGLPLQGPHIAERSQVSFRSSFNSGIASFRIRTSISQTFAVMPSAIYGTPYVNKAPLFFCSHGSKNHCTEALKSSFTAPAGSSNPEAKSKCRTCQALFSSNNLLHLHLKATVEHQRVKDPPPPVNYFFPFAWPAGKHLRVKTLPGHSVHGEILAIIAAAFLEWTPSLGEALSFTWVPQWEEADIRISFRNEEPNWSALGSKAVFYEEATMNFAFGGWKEKLTVFPHATIKRAAAHLFGHALGV